MDIVTSCDCGCIPGILDRVVRHTARHCDSEVQKKKSTAEFRKKSQLHLQQMDKRLKWSQNSGLWDAIRLGCSSEQSMVLKI